MYFSRVESTRTRTKISHSSQFFESSLDTPIFFLLPWFWRVKILHHMITCTLPKTNKKNAFPKNQSSLPTTNFQVVLLLVLGMVNHVTHHIGSQLLLASKILLPKKENKCQPFHPPKSSSWNIVLLVGPASHLAIFQLLTHPARALDSPSKWETQNMELETWSAFGMPENSFVQTLLRGSVFSKGY